MTKEVINHGVIYDDGSKKEHTCECCSCQFSYEHEDLDYKKGCFFIKCPECGNSAVAPGFKAPLSAFI